MICLDLLRLLLLNMSILQNELCLPVILNASKTLTWNVSFIFCDRTWFLHIIYLGLGVIEQIDFKNLKSLRGKKKNLHCVHEFNTDKLKCVWFVTKWIYSSNLSSLKIFQVKILKHSTDSTFGFFKSDGQRLLKICVWLCHCTQSPFHV